MTRPKKGSRLAPDEFDDAEIDGEDREPAAAGEPGTTELDALKAACATMAGQKGATLTVNKVCEGVEKRCWTFNPIEFDENVLPARWGSGVFYVYARAAGKLVDRFKIEFAPTGDTPPQSRGPGPNMLPISAADPLAGVRELIVSSQQAQREQFNDFKTLLLEVLRPQQQPPAANPMQVVEMMERIKALNGNPRQGSSDIETLLKGVRLARDLGIDPESALDDSPPPWARTALRLAERFLGDGESAAPTRASPDQAVRPGTPPGGEPADMNRIVAAMVSKQLPTLLRGAAAGSDPGIYAQLLLDQLPESMQGWVYQQLKSPDWFDVLSKIDARSVPHRAWLTQLRDSFLAAMEEAAAPAGDEAAAPPPAGNG